MRPPDKATQREQNSRNPPHSGPMRLATIAAVLAVAGAAPAHVACNRQPHEQEGGSRPRVAFVMKTFNHPFFLDMKRGAEDAAARLGVQLVAQAAERELDVERQMQIIENLIQTGVRALCVTPSGSREIVSALGKATRAGIPIVVADTRVDPAAATAAGLKLSTFIGSDNYEGGRIAGEYVVQLTGGRAKVGILEGIPGHETGDSRLRGFRDAVARAPGITIVASQPANWERDQGFTVFQNMLQAHPEIDAMFACSDLMALGAIEAVAAANRTGRVHVVGFDALEDARTAIQAGRMAGSVAQSPRDMGRLAVESAAMLIRGESVPAEQKVAIRLVTKESATAAQ
jgi:ribose transport system substrate-binding protein